MIMILADDIDSTISNRLDDEIRLNQSMLFSLSL